MVSSFRRISRSISRGMVAKVAICEKPEPSAAVGLVGKWVATVTKLVGVRVGYSPRGKACSTSGWR